MSMRMPEWRESQINLKRDWLISLKRDRLLWRSSLYANSLYLIAGGGATAVLGFVFWTVAARLYQPDEVGIAAAAISAVGLLSMFSTLGLEYALVRFLPQATDPEAIINSSLTIGAAASLVLSLLFVVGLTVWSPPMRHLGMNPLMAASLVIATIATTVGNLIGATFLARKRSTFFFAQTVIFGGARILFAVILAVVALPAGLIGAWILGLLVAAACGIGVLLPRVEDGRYLPKMTATPGPLKDMISYALANYLSSLLWNAPIFLLPLLMISLAGPRANAHFYVAFNISNILAAIPVAFALSLLVHGSHDEERLAQHAIDGIRGALWLLVPGIVGIFLLGDKVLLMFGRQYFEQDSTLLRILVLSALPITVNSFFFSVWRVRQHMRAVVISNAWVLATALGLSAVLLPRMGLIGAGVAWFIAQGSVATLLVVLYLFRSTKRSP